MAESNNYRSCFVTDVKVRANGGAVLTDSQRNTYYVDFDKDMDNESFDAWLDVFLKGVSQTLTVFQYVDRGQEGDFELHAVKFINVPKKMVNG